MIALQSCNNISLYSKAFYTENFYCGELQHILSKKIDNSLLFVLIKKKKKEKHFSATSASYSNELNL